MLRGFTIVIAVMSAPIAQAETKERPPAPIGWPWVKVSDYPPAAIRASQEGTVMIAVTVDVSGRMTDCRIEVSSGSSALDQTSCRLMQRGRFEPARDAQGKAVTGTFSNRITWRLPKDTANKLGERIIRDITWEIDALDRLLSCSRRLGKFTSTCPPDFGRGRRFLADVARIRAKTAINGSLRSTFAISMAVDDKEPPVELPPLAAGDVLISEITSRFSTDEAGRPFGCTSIVAGIDKPSPDEVERGSPCERKFRLPVMSADGRPVAARHVVVTRTTVRALAAKR